MKIVIDPGHGGTEPGAIANGYKEKDINLPLSLKVKDLLKDYCEVIMTRTSDIDMSLSARAKVAKDNNADLLLSLHHNAYDGKANGCEAIYSIKATEDCKHLADALVKGMVSEIGVIYRRIFSKESTTIAGQDWYGIPRYSLPVQSIILESFFMDHKGDFGKMNLNKQAYAIANVIKNHYKLGVNAMNPIMGKSQATAEQMNTFIKRVNPNAPDNLGQMYIEEGETEGVRGDIAFAQALKETNYWRFTGDAKIEWNNPAGLGVDSSEKIIGYTPDGQPIKEHNGNKFPDWRTGIRAQIQHLKGYATKEPLNQPCVDQRWGELIKKKLIGAAPNWEQLNGKWAYPGTTYGQDIIKIWKQILEVPIIEIDYKAIAEQLQKDNKLKDEQISLMAKDLTAVSDKYNSLKAGIKVLVEKY